ncbi:hypothetical protein O6H91_05G126800 [Diphasiastrum complanatum]|uniref:Uncharacterized protein n=1 Tax=Diphasiastrum complanatum TaxID=34168 RepID=A0ACC2DTC2_DIPCM|nr:hypothetical protein O6H91_05G126800 [Diphasiastrum complanatum]
MAASNVIIWLHGLGDTGPANAALRSFFTKPQLKSAKWHFPTAPRSPVTCNRGAVLTSWFDLPEIPITAASPSCQEDVLNAVRGVHTMIDDKVASGIDASRIFLCGFSQGGALTLASSMLYPETLAGAVVFSGWVPLDSNFIEKISPKAKKTPVFVAHGDADEVVHFAAGQAIPPILAQAGVKHEFKAFRGLGHSISPEELAHLERWLISNL